MLLTYEPAPYPVGIAVNTWKTKKHFKLFGGRLRIFVLFPVVRDGRYMMDVGRFEQEKHKLMPIKPYMQDWRDITDGPNDGFGDEAQGYPVDFDTAKDIYAVWQDGSQAHPEASERLYEKYSRLVDYYAMAAREYLEQKAKEQPQNVGLMLDFPYKK